MTEPSKVENCGVQLRIRTLRGKPEQAAMSQQILRQSGGFQLIETTTLGGRGRPDRAYTVRQPGYEEFYQGSSLQEAIAAFDRAISNVANDH
jgi:hypothetical protein